MSYILVALFVFFSGYRVNIQRSDLSSDVDGGRQKINKNRRKKDFIQVKLSMYGNYKTTHLTSVFINVYSIQTSLSYSKSNEQNLLIYRKRTHLNNTPRLYSTMLTIRKLLKTSYKTEYKPEHE